MFHANDEKYHFNLWEILWGGTQSYLEVVLHIAVSVLGDVQEDEQVLPQVVSHRLDPGQGVQRQCELHHFRGWRPGRLDELREKQAKRVNRDPSEISSQFTARHTTQPNWSSVWGGTHFIFHQVPLSHVTLAISPRPID